MRVYLFAAVAFAFIIDDLVIVIFIIIITVSALLLYYTSDISPFVQLLASTEAAGASAGRRRRL